MNRSFSSVTKIKRYLAFCNFMFHLVTDFSFRFELSMSRINGNLHSQLASIYTSSSDTLEITTSPILQHHINQLKCKHTENS